MSTPLSSLQEMASRAENTSSAEQQPLRAGFIDRVPAEETIALGIALIGYWLYRAIQTIKIERLRERGVSRVREAGGGGVYSGNVSWMAGEDATAVAARKRKELEKCGQTSSKTPQKISPTISPTVKR